MVGIDMVMDINNLLITILSGIMIMAIRVNIINTQYKAVMYRIKCARHNIRLAMHNKDMLETEEKFNAGKEKFVNESINLENECKRHRIKLIYADIVMVFGIGFLSIFDITVDSEKIRTSITAMFILVPYIVYIVYNTEIRFNRIYNIFFAKIYATFKN